VFEAFLMLVYTKSATVQLRSHDREPNHKIIEKLKVKMYKKEQIKKTSKRVGGKDKWKIMTWGERLACLLEDYPEEERKKGHVNTKSKIKITSQIQRFCYCRCPFPFNAFCKTKTYDSAVHKLYRVFFKHHYRREIQKSLHGRSADFDFATYLQTFWE